MVMTIIQQAVSAFLTLIILLLRGIPGLPLLSRLGLSGCADPLSSLPSTGVQSPLDTPPGALSTLHVPPLLTPAAVVEVGSLVMTESSCGGTLPLPSPAQPPPPPGSAMSPSAEQPSSSSSTSLFLQDQLQIKRSQGGQRSVRSPESPTAAVVCVKTQREKIQQPWHRFPGREHKVYVWERCNPQTTNTSITV